MNVRHISEQSSVSQLVLTGVLQVWMCIVILLSLFCLFPAGHHAMADMTDA